MAVTGIPLIAPASGGVGVRHRIANLYVKIPDGQDGVWSSPAAGTQVTGVYITSGGNGTNSYGLRVGSTTAGTRGHYSDVVIESVSGTAIWLTNVEECQFTRVDIDRPAFHAINIDQISNRNLFNQVTMSEPSFGNTNTYDAIHITDGDYNEFDQVILDTSQTTVHKNTVDFSGGTFNRLGTLRIDPGVTGTFLETAVGDNDFGMDIARLTITGNLSVASHPVRIYAEVARQIYACRAVVNTAPVGAAIIVDVNVNGTTIYGTAANPTIADGTNTGAWALPDRTTLIGTPVAKASYVTIDVDQVGSGTAGADMTIEIMWKKE